MTKKRIGIYLLLTFALTWGVMLPFFLLGGSYENPAVHFVLTYSMLCPAIAVLITRKVTGEGWAVTGKDSLLLGLDLKNKKWIWFVLALVGPIVYLDLGDLLFYGMFPQAFDPDVLDALGVPRKLLFLLPGHQSTTAPVHPPEASATAVCPSPCLKIRTKCSHGVRIRQQYG